MLHRATEVGHVVSAVAGTVFLGVNGGAVGDGARPWLLLLGAAATAVVVVAHVRSVRRGEAGRDATPADRRFGLVVLAEVVALFAGLAVLNRVLPEAALAWIALVVGLHFLPLARIFPEVRQALTGIALVMAVLGVVGFVLALVTGEARPTVLVSGVGSGLVLLGAGLGAAVQTLAGTREETPVG